MVSLGKIKAKPCLRCIEKANNMYGMYGTQLLISFENEIIWESYEEAKAKGEGNCSGKSFFQFCFARCDGRKKLMVDRGVCGADLNVIILLM